MTTTPDCPCFADPKRAAQRETETQALGAAFGELFRANASVHAYCDAAWPYLAGACLAGLAASLAYFRMAEGQETITTAQMLEALDLVVAASRARIEGATLQNMRAEGSA